MIYNDEQLGQGEVVHVADLNALHRTTLVTWGRERWFVVHLCYLAHDSVEGKDIFASRRTRSKEPLFISMEEELLKRSLQNVGSVMRQT